MNIEDEKVISLLEWRKAREAEKLEDTERHDSLDILRYQVMLEEALNKIAATDSSIKKQESDCSEIPDTPDTFLHRWALCFLNQKFTDLCQELAPKEKPFLAHNFLCMMGVIALLIFMVHVYIPILVHEITVSPEVSWAINTLFTFGLYAFLLLLMYRVSTTERLLKTLQIRPLVLKKTL